MSLFLSQSPDASVYLSHPFCPLSVCQYVFPFTCHSWRMLCIRCLPFPYLPIFTLMPANTTIIRESTWISPEAITLSLLPNGSFIQKTHTHTSSPLSSSQSPFILSLCTCTNYTHLAFAPKPAKRRCQVEEIHHSDRWSAAASRTAMCGSVSAFGDDLVSQSFIQVLLTYGDHIQQTDIILPQKRTWCIWLLSFSIKEMKGYSFGLLSWLFFL